MPHPSAAAQTTLISYYFSRPPSQFIERKNIYINLTTYSHETTNYDEANLTKTQSFPRPKSQINHHSRSGKRGTPTEQTNPINNHSNSDKKKKTTQNLSDTINRQINHTCRDKSKPKNKNRKKEERRKKRGGKESSPGIVGMVQNGLGKQKDEELEERKKKI